MSWGKYKLKQWDNTVHLFEWPKPQPLTTPNDDEDVEEQEHLFIGSVNAKQYKHFRRQFGGFLQTKHTLTV